MTELDALLEEIVSLRNDYLKKQFMFLDRLSDAETIDDLDRLEKEVDDLDAEYYAKRIEIGNRLMALASDS